MTDKNPARKESSDQRAVDIGMPVYNGERYIEETLESVANQTFEDYRLYISDNASTDRTEEICRDWAKKDPRIHYIRNARNVGAAGNYEVCYRAGDAQYFRWQNADDTIAPTLIEDCLEVLEQEPDVVLAYGKSHIIDANGKFVRAYDDNLFLMQDSPVERFTDCLHNIGLQNLMYGLIRRSSLDQTKRMQAYVSADINLIGELVLYGKFYEIQRHLFNCRRHEECSSWDMSDTKTLREFWQPGKERLVLQSWRGALEFFRAVSRSPLSFRDKRACLTFLLKHYYWRKNEMFSELSDFVKHGFS